MPALALLLLVLACAASCSRHHDPQVVYEQAQQAFQHGDLKRSLEIAKRGYGEFQAGSPKWRWKFRTVEANALLSLGKSSDALNLLTSEPKPTYSNDLTVQVERLEVTAYAASGDLVEAGKTLTEAEHICASSSNPSCSGIASLRGWLDVQLGHFALAEGPFKQALASARENGNHFLEANALLNLSWSAEKLGHLDQGLDWANEARQIAIGSDFAGLAQKALGNMGWAYYNLGDPEKAEGMFIEAESQAEKLGEPGSRIGWLVDTGYVDLDTGKFPAALQAFAHSLNLAREIDSKEDVITALEALAFVYERTDNLPEAKRYADDALAKAAEAGNVRDMVYSWLVEGQVAALEHDTFTAKSNFTKVAASPDSPVFLKWEAERSLARLYEDEKQPLAAEQEYRTALNTFETARSELHHEDSRLPFLTNATGIYDDYIHFLIAQGKADEALQVAEYSRARTLSEGLGLLSTGIVKKGASFNPEPVNAQAIARRAGGTILFYWLGEKQSYLWVVTPRTTRLFPLNVSSAEIDAAVRTYRSKLEGPPEILEASNDGSTLYKMLIEPAGDLLTKEAFARNDQIFIIPDGSLNSLNFETLTPQLNHYWIEDVTITSAGSLHLLSAARPTPKQLTGKLLLIGNPVSPTSAGDHHSDNPYPELPDAALEIGSIEQHFPPAQQTVFTREQATPSAFDAHPERFSYIHFVAHGTASRTSPLDSAIILSRNPGSQAAAGEEDDSFKLYARDIIQHPLHAELVTISACYGAGKRSYSGEGLVGLSWAFLRAGAHNVVGALWDVSSVSSAQLMDDFYGELQKGKRPSSALRAAKLKLLHSTNPDFRRPFYWAPFQLYTGA
jgi:CHAT domain-containing protein